MFCGIAWALKRQININCASSYPLIMMCDIVSQESLMETTVLGHKFLSSKHCANK